MSINTISKTKKLVRGVFRYVILITFCMISIFPIYFSLVSSFKDNNTIFQDPFGLPTTFSFDQYIYAITSGNLGVAFLNSLYLGLMTLLLTSLLSIGMGYILSRYSFKIRDVIYIFVISGMMIPIQSTLIPISLIFSDLGLINSHTALIMLFTAFQIPISVLILTSFIKSIPTEMEEAAVIDGASAHVVFRRIIVPLTMPATASVSIFTFVMVWNNLVFPLIFISDKDKQVVAYGLLQFVADKSSDYAGLLAGVIITCVPPIIIYALMQERVEKGLTAGAVKG